jgi:hypothetical protein
MAIYGGFDDARRRRFCEIGTTLDGSPARITGWANPFAQVTRTDGRGGTVEFSWPTVARVLACGGEFHA